MNDELTHDRITDEIAKLMDTTSKLNAENAKLNAEASKLTRETFWYPLAIASALVGSVAAITLALSRWIS
ncbi:hypothetical protein [Azorhizophilus paspali]|uniref:Uncharacterized protein n=1 Tax=Azorhizophilus paspali TaxID=69963 RepID=A0ABV6SGS1_AZOPA